MSMIAHQILAVSRNADDADESARNEAVTTRHELWTSIYTFADGSVLAVTGSQINAYDNMEQAEQGENV